MKGTIGAAVGPRGMIGAAALLGATLALPVAAHEADGHPARLHAGTCEELGRVAYSLNGVGAEVDLAGEPVDPGEAVNDDRADLMARSETELDAALDDLLEAPHALVIYESDEDLTVVSCGNLGGSRVGDELAVGLAAPGGSGQTGIALLEGEGGATRVRIFLGDADAEGTGGGHGPADAAADDRGADEGGTPDAATPAADA